MVSSVSMHIDALQAFTTTAQLARRPQPAVDAAAVMPRA
jgi:hypothetical protein